MSSFQGGLVHDVGQLGTGGQDSILVTFLNLAGFDILFFVPTGYQSVENYFAEKLMEEHQIGEYKYDMQVPDLNNISTNSTRPSWRRKLFRRG